MPAVKREERLRPDQRRIPVVWMVQATIALPTVTDLDLEPAFGPGAARQLKSWGHDEAGVHWLATRKGTGLHTDPAYARYSHHLIVRNDGWRIRGIDDDLHPPMVRGALYCLDTHSPHEVTDDPRMPCDWSPRFKVQLVFDHDRMHKPGEVFPLLRAYLEAGHHPRDRAAEAALSKRAPSSVRA
jgi:hypothetical protein